MAIFGNMSITNAGQNLYAKAQSGKPIVFTRMQLGSGQIGTQNPATLVSLVTPQFDVPISSITANTDLKTATVSGTINNSAINTAIYICEIALWAQDPDVGEILYSYASAGSQGDYMAPASQGAYSWNYQINAAVGNAANVTANISSLNYDYGIVISDTSFTVISGGNQKEINKSIDTKLKANADALASHSADNLYQLAGGTATAITLTGVVLEDGHPKTFIASADNGGSATTINGLHFYKPATTTSPTVKAGKAYTFWYNLAGNCFFIKASAEGNTIPSHVLAGDIFSTDVDTGQVGTAPLKTGVTYTPTTSDQTITTGWEDGTCKVKGDANLVASNILSGKSIFNINGSAIDGATMRKHASGSVKDVSGTVTVTGLGFAPIVIRVNAWEGSWAFVGLWSSSVGSGTQGGYNWCITATGSSPWGPSSVTADGFVCSVPTNQWNTTWECWG